MKVIVVEHEGIECDVCVRNGEFAVCDREDLVIVGNVESWWGCSVIVNHVVGEYVRVAGSDKYIGGSTVGREDHFWRVDCEYAMYGIVCWKIYYWQLVGW